MAPSLQRKSRTTTKKPVQTQTQIPIKTSGFGRVSKSSQVQALHVKKTDVVKRAYEKISGDGGREKLEEKSVKKEIEICVPVLVTKGKKRGIDEVESEDDDDDVTAAKKNLTGRKIKARKVQLLSPPNSSCGTDTESSEPGATQRVKELPETLRDMVDLHAVFLRALTLHSAHSGPSVPAELSALLGSVTRLWKRSVVPKEMVQRMLALYELGFGPGMVDVKTVKHKDGPFKLVTSGLGSGVRTSIEFVGRASRTGAFEERLMQTEYQKVVQRVFDASYTQDFSFVNGPISDFPLLAIPVGSQTQARQEKASVVRNEILSLSNAAQSRSLPNFSKLSIGTDQPDSMSTSASTKSRTLSLFDRVRAKGLASSSSSAPTNEQILRRHAIGRITEVVEFLRMKQQQKIGAQFALNIDEASEQTRRGKISFSLNSVVNEIRQSVPIPIGDEEVRCCLRMLSEEVPQWLTCLNMGTVHSVTLVGSGMSGLQVKKMIEDKERRV